MPTARKVWTEIVILPSFLASALINGDTSGIEDNPFDLEWLEKALYLSRRGGSYVGVSEETHFSNWCSIPEWRLAADMAEYTILYSEEI